MNWVAGLLLLHHQSEFDTFTSFVNLLSRGGLLLESYQLNDQEAKKTYAVFKILMKDRLPNTFETLEQSELYIERKEGLSSFLVPWVRSLFSSIVSFKTAARLCDNYLFHGDFWLMKAALALCCCLNLSSSISHEVTMMMLKNPRKWVNEERLLKVISSIHLT